MNVNDRVGGLPVWGWLGIGVLGAGLFMLSRRRKGAQGAVAPPAGGGAAPGVPLRSSTGFATPPQPAGISAMPNYQMGIPLVAVAVEQPGAPAVSATSPYQKLGGPMAATDQAAGGNTQGGALDIALAPGQLAAEQWPDSSGGGVGTGAGTPDSDGGFDTNHPGNGTPVAPDTDVSPQVGPNWAGLSIPPENQHLYQYTGPGDPIQCPQGYKIVWSGYPVAQPRCAPLGVDTDKNPGAVIDGTAAPLGKVSPGGGTTPGGTGSPSTGAGKLVPAPLSAPTPKLDANRR